MEHFSLWLAAFLTLGIFSFLYKDNPWYKLSEAIFVGVSAGYWFVVLFWDNLVGKLVEGIFPPEVLNQDGIMVPVAEPDYTLLVGGLLGLLMLFRLIPKIGWMSRWSLAFIVGATSGLWMMNYLATNIMAQTQATILPLFSTSFGSGMDLIWSEIIGRLVIIVGTFTGLVYFFFSKEHTGVFGGTARVGIFFLMITFGASFGYTVMSRMSLLIGRIDFLLHDFLGMIN
jgi:hypothetical protein